MYTRNGGRFLRFFNIIQGLEVRVGRVWIGQDWPQCDDLGAM